MVKVLLVGLGGFCGAILRYSISEFVVRLTGNWFPFGTFIVNLVGCLILGLALSFLNQRYPLEINLRIFLVVGIIGSFTTYSAFAHESFGMLSDQRYLPAAINFCLHLFICIGSVWAGLVLGQSLVKG